MFCTKCGTFGMLNDKFCQKCGNPIANVEAKEHGIIIFKRDCLLGFAMNMHLYLNDRKIGTLENKNEMRVDVAYGKHRITGHLPAGKHETIEIEVSPEKRIIVIDCWVEISMGIVGHVRFGVS